jgi:hypothetical protein
VLCRPVWASAGPLVTYWDADHSKARASRGYRGTGGEVGLRHSLPSLLLDQIAPDFYGPFVILAFLGQSNP